MLLIVGCVAYLERGHTTAYWPVGCAPNHRSRCSAFIRAFLSFVFHLHRAVGSRSCFRRSTLQQVTNGQAGQAPQLLLSRRMTTIPTAIVLFSTALMTVLRMKTWSVQAATKVALIHPACQQDGARTTMVVRNTAHQICTKAFRSRMLVHVSCCKAVYRTM